MNRETTHNHFDGTLPVDFLCKKITGYEVLPELLLPAWNRYIAIDHATITPQVLQTQLKHVFTGNSRQNVPVFFELYALLRKLVQQKFAHEAAATSKRSSYYFEGAQAIAKDMHAQQLDRYVILMGATNELSAFIHSLEGVVSGFQVVEAAQGTKEKGFVRVTFSRAADGEIKNSSPEALLELLEYLEQNPAFRARVDGFDFCGFENPQQLEPTLELLKLLSDYNRYADPNETQKPYSISIHAGENCFDWSASDHLSAFETLFPLAWDMVGHGTFLWLPHSLLTLTDTEDAYRKRLLRAYAEKGFIFEICPTSNILLTPMQSGLDFPTQQFLDENIQFTINPDDAILYSTTYDQELGLVGLKYSTK